LKEPGTQSSEMSIETSKRVLQPIERLSEALFGLIMVLTFTGSLSAAESGHAEVRSMLLGALGCNLAWALIDALMYVMGSLSERAASVRLVLSLQKSVTANEVRQAITSVVPSVVASALTQEDFQRIRREAMEMPGLPERARLEKQDLLGAVAVFLLVIASTIPVVLPFFFIADALTALRASNAIAIVMMFALGFQFGRLAGYRPLLTGGSMVVLGSAIVALTIALGG
jgi:VIT1/CCC1 family predicted Fe2+/Mn2+ transporter